MLEKIRPALLPNMSVNFPLNGWRAAFAIRYAVAIHDTNVKE